MNYTGTTQGQSTSCQTTAKQQYPKPSPETKAKVKHLKQYISPIHHGFEKWDGPTLLGPRPCFTIKSVNSNFKKGWGARQVTIEQLRQHHEMGMPRFYTMSTNGERLLVNIDTDVGKRHGSSATTQNAQQLADAIQEALAVYPGVTYDEPSTHFEGIHQYVELVNEQNGRPLTFEQIAEALRKLAAVFRAIKKQINSPVKDVEIKGHPAKVEWSGTDDRNSRGKRYRIVQKFGQLAKVPWLSREGDLERLKNTTRLTIQDIDELYLQYVGSDTAKHSPAKRAAVTAKAERPAKGGSCCQLTKESQAGMPLWDRWFSVRGCNNLKTRGGENRSVVLSRDFAIARAMISIIQKLLKPGEPFRQSRIEALWNKLYDEGAVDRAWCHHRWTVIRNRLTDMGYVFSRDNRYWFTIDGGPGTGRAMIWRLGEWMIQACPSSHPATAVFSGGIVAGKTKASITATGQTPAFPFDPLKGPHGRWRPHRILFFGVFQPSMVDCEPEYRLAA